MQLDSRGFEPEHEAQTLRFVAAAAATPITHLQAKLDVVCYCHVVEQGIALKHHANLVIHRRSISVGSARMQRGNNRENRC